MKKAIYLILPFCLFFACVQAHGQANLSFSGGNNNPLVVTLSQPVVYTITSTASSGVPFFIFKGVGNFGSVGTVSGTIHFTTSMGTSGVVNDFYSGTTFASNVTPTDAVLYGSLPGATIGETITLTSGMLTSTSSFASAPPSSGSFTTFITDDFGDQFSTNGLAVPEPSTWLGGFLLSSVVVLGSVQKWRRSSTLPPA